MNYLRDTREQSFSINDEYLNGYARLCGINATGVYMSLSRHVDKKQTCFPAKKLNFINFREGRDVMIVVIRKWQNH